MTSHAALKLARPDPDRPCPNCGGRQFTAFITCVPMADKDRLYVIAGIPALRCSGCSEGFFETAIADRLHAIRREEAKVAATNDDFRVVTFR